MVSSEGTVEFSFVSPALWEHPEAAGRHPKRGDPVLRRTAAFRLANSPEMVRDVAEDADAAGLYTWFPECDGEGELVEESVGLGRYGRVLTVLSAPELPDQEDR